MSFSFNIRPRSKMDLSSHESLGKKIAVKIALLDIDKSTYGDVNGGRSTIYL